MENDTLGARLRRRRLKLGLTLDEVAKKSGLTTGTVSDLEQGRQKGSKRLHHVTTALGLNIKYAETGEGPEELTEVKDDQGVYGPQSIHGFWPTREGAQVGAEWDKIKDPAVKQFIHNVIFGHVGAQARGETPPPMPTIPKSPGVSIRRSETKDHSVHKSRKGPPSRRVS